MAQILKADRGETSILSVSLGDFLYQISYICNAKIRLTNDNIFDMLVLYYSVKHDFIWRYLCSFCFQAVPRNALTQVFTVPVPYSLIIEEVYG